MSENGDDMDDKQNGNEYNVDKSGLIAVSIVVAGALVGGGIYLASNNEPEPPMPAYSAPFQVEPRDPLACERLGGVWVDDPNSTLFSMGDCVDWEG